MDPVALLIFVLLGIVAIGIWLLPPYWRRSRVKPTLWRRHVRGLIDDPEMRRWNPEAAKREPIGSFSSDGRRFNVYIIDEGANHDRDLKVLSQGYTHRRMYGAREDVSGQIYVVWEFYHKAGECFLSKAIDVDERFQGQGIGSGLLDVVMLHHKGNIQLSGKYTAAGASLIKQYAVGWMPPPLDNCIRSRRHKKRQ